MCLRVFLLLCEHNDDFYMHLSISLSVTNFAYVGMLGIYRGLDPTSICRFPLLTIIIMLTAIGYKMEISTNGCFLLKC
jgi:hypothetical protein